MAARRGKSPASKAGRPAGRARPGGKPARANAKPKPKPKAGSRARPAKAPSRPRAARAPRPSAIPLTFSGGCHCGAIEYTYTTSRLPRAWTVERCACSFCRGHAARSVADPGGEVQFDFRLPEHLRRYRFGLRTAEFLLCRDCGMYVAAVLITGRGALASINVNTLKEPPRDLPAGRLLAQTTESSEERRARRAAAWTPVVGPV